MSSSAITTQVAQLKIGNVQNQADNSAVYSGGVWSFKNSTALTSVTITDAGNVGVGVTPSAWGSIKAIQMGNNGAFVCGGIAFKDMYVGSNAYFDGTNWRYVTSSDAGYYSVAGSSHYWYGAVSGAAGAPTTFTERMRIATDGNVLVTGGLIGSTGTYNTGTGSAANVHILSNGYMLRSTSALKYKEDITPISYGLDTVLSMKPVEYKSKCEADKDAEHKFIGFIADWEEANLPALVQKDGEGEVEGFSYDRLTAVLCKAIQEQQAQIEALKAEVAALKAK